MLRAVATGQEGRATSGRAAIGGRRCARQRVVDACRARAPCPGEWGRPAGPSGVSQRTRRASRGLPATTPEATRHACAGASNSMIRCFCRLCALRYSLQLLARGSHATVNASLAWLLQFVHVSWAPATCRRWFRNRDFILVSNFQNPFC